MKVRGVQLEWVQGGSEARGIWVGALLALEVEASELMMLGVFGTFGAYRFGPESVTRQFQKL